MNRWYPVIGWTLVGVSLTLLLWSNYTVRREYDLLRSKYKYVRDAAARHVAHERSLPVEQRSELAQRVHETWVARVVEK